MFTCMRGDKSGRKDGTFERADFTYDAENDLYICPGGKELRKPLRAYKAGTTGAHKDETIRYRARKRVSELLCMTDMAHAS